MDGRKLWFGLVCKARWGKCMRILWKALLPLWFCWGIFAFWQENRTRIFCHHTIRFPCIAKIKLHLSSAKHTPPATALWPPVTFLYEIYPVLSLSHTGSPYPLLILECLERGWYPSWDAQNKESVALAEKLGYHFDYEYVAYEVYLRRG